MELTRLIVTKPDGTVVGDVDPTRVVDATYVREVNGEHSITLVTLDELSKNDRLLWRDETGAWHENVVEGMEGAHTQGDTLHTYWCPWSLQHDLAATVVTAMPGTGGTPAPARTALEAAIGGTERWVVGTVTVTSRSCASMWRMSGWEAMQVLVEVWGGEVAATIEVGNSGVTARKVDFLTHVGKEAATRRFDYGGDLMGITRTVSDQPWTCRVFPLGKAEETEGGGHGRKIAIESVNGGVPWLENTSVTPLVRVPFGDGWEYPIQVVENPDAETPAALKAWAQENIEEWTLPKASYEVDVLQLSQAGVDATGVAEGDAVVIVDRDFDPEGLVISGRALRVEGSLLDPAQTTLTISNLTDTLGDSLGGIARSVARLSEQQEATSLYQSTAAYLSELLGRLNDEANATGGYTYITEGQGLRTYDVAVSDPLVGTEASAVVEVKGGTIRIANSRTSSGEWDWKTVFTSGHIAANLVTAAQITAGYIGSADSGNYWDLDSGEFRLASVSGLLLSAANLVRNGDFSNGTTYWGGVGATISSYTDSDRGTVLRCVQSGEGGSSYRTYATSANFAHAEGRTYSISFWAKASAANTLYVNRISFIVANCYVRGESIGTTWQRYTGTITAISDGGVLNFSLGSAGTLYISDVMLVEGAVPMLDWSPDPRDALVAVDAYLTQTEIFNRLTNNGALQGLYMSSGQLYVNAEYIKTGYLSANRIQGGVLKLGGSNNGNGQLEVYDASGTKTGTINNDGANLTGQITLRNVVSSGTTNVRSETAIGSLTIVDSSKYWNLTGGNSGGVERTLVGLKAEEYGANSGTLWGRLMLIPSATGSSYWNTLTSNRSLMLINMEGADSSNCWILLRNNTAIDMGVNKDPTTGAGPVRITSSGMNVGSTSTTMNLTVNGTKNRQVSTEGFGDRLLYCYETPSPHFGDIGSGMTDESGECYVELDERLTEAMRTDLAYQCFLQPCGEGTLWVAEKAPGWFVVRGTPNLPFDWEVKARQTGYEAERLEDPELRDARDTAGETDLGVEALYEEEMGLIGSIEDIYEEETT